MKIAKIGINIYSLIFVLLSIIMIILFSIAIVKRLRNKKFDLKEKMSLLECGITYILTSCIELCLICML